MFSGVDGAVATVPADRQRAPHGRGRYPRLDALRGLALVWMTLYHFSFDLDHFGYIDQDFYRDPVWTLQRTAIVSLFLFTAGFGQALAVEAGQSWHRFWRRWLQVAGCAVLVSIGSWWMFPASWISFGVLHGIAMMLLLTRWMLARWAPSAIVLALLGLGLLAVAPLLGAWLASADAPTLTAVLDSRWLNGLGIVTHKPVTEDYVPILPWLGVVLLGAAAASRVPREMLGRPGGFIVAPLALLGRWSLSYYMLHQLVLIGALAVWQTFGA